MRKRLAWILRRWSDRIDPDNAPRYASPYTWTIELGEGLRLREDGRGCPLVYMSEADHTRAYTEANRPI